MKSATPCILWATQGKINVRQALYREIVAILEFAVQLIGHSFCFNVDG